jgi:hypothetical protein
MAGKKQVNKGVSGGGGGGDGGLGDGSRGRGGSGQRLDGSPSASTRSKGQLKALKRARSQKMSLIPVSATKKIRTLQYSRLCQRRSHSFKVVVNI